MRTIAVYLMSAIIVVAVHSVFAEEKNRTEYLNKGGLLPEGMPFSPAVKVGNTYYLSGQIGTIPGSVKLPEGGIKAEAKQVMDNIKTTLGFYGLSMNNLVKCLVMLADISEWGDFNKVYITYFLDHFPARSAFAANGLALGARVEVECIAVE